MDKIKFAELVAKTGVHFGAVDGNYDDKEKAFVNLFIGFLKAQGAMDGDVENIIKTTNNGKYTLEELVNETKNQLKGLSEDEKKATLKGMSNFINTIICVDGMDTYDEQQEYAKWKSDLGVTD